MKTLLPLYMRQGLVCLSLAILTELPAQIVLDGNKCPGEWGLAAAVDVDYKLVPATSDLSRFWYELPGTTINFAFTRKLNLTGSAAFSIYLNTDNDTTTGYIPLGGAEIALFMNINSGTIATKQVLEWDNLNGNFVVTSVTMQVELGDSTCTGPSQNFFEVGVAAADIVDVCNMDSTGAINLTYAASHAGQVFQSQLVDTMRIGANLFINTPPLANVDPDGLILCSGETGTLDARGSLANATGSTSTGTITKYEWDIDYNGTFKTDTITPTLDLTYIEYVDSSIHTFALVVTDTFGCTDTLTDIEVIVYKLPELSIDIFADNAPRCKDWLWHYNTTFSMDYKGDPVNTIRWELPDGSVLYGDTILHYYDPCLFALPNFGDLRAIAIDDHGCRDTAYDRTYLSVEVKTWKAERIDSAVELNWEVTAESVITSYTIERSEDARKFEEVGTVQVLEVMPEGSEYRFIDPTASTSKDHYYRLRLNYATSEINYLEILVVEALNTSADLKIYPNPSNEVLHIESTNSGEQSYSMYDMMGRKIFSGDFNSHVILDLNAIESGAYYVSISDGNNTQWQKIIKE